MKTSNHFLSAISLVSKALSCDLVSEDAELNKIQEWDSLGHVSVLLQLEQEFGIEFSDESISRYTSIGQIANLIKEKSLQMKKKELAFELGNAEQRTSGTFCYSTHSPRGLVLFMHGITSDREEWGLFTDVANLLCHQNISSFRFDYRGHGKAKKINPQIFTLSGIISDLDNAFQLMKKEIGNELLNMKVIVVGSSFGGGVASIWSTIHSKMVSKLILCAPVLSYSDDLNRSVPDWGKQIQKKGWFKYGNLTLTQEFLNELDKYNIYNDIVFSGINTIVFHGELDSDVPISSSQKLVDLAKSVDLVPIPNADHGFTLPGDIDIEKQESREIQKTVAQNIVTEIKKSINE